jgi:hypothetical protein
MKEIPKRIFTGFLVYSMISLVVSVVSFELFRRMEATEKLNTHINNLFNKTVHAIKLGQDFMLYEIYQDRFFRTGHSVSLDKYEILLRGVDSIQKNIADIKNIQRGELYKEIIILDNLMQSYDSIFKIIVRKETLRGFKDYGIIGKMKSNIKELEAETNINITDILLMRKYEKDYMINGDSASILAHKAMYHTIDKNLLANTKLINQKRKHLRTSLENYLNAFNQIIQLEGEIGHHRQVGLSIEMKEILLKIDQTVDKISILAVQQKEGINATIKVVFLTIITVSVLLILLMAIAFRYMTSF